MNSKSPFGHSDDAGIPPLHAFAHKPGMADALMEQLAPLLAADGFDLDNLGDDVDMAQLNQAMARAVQRHNMELVTPVGDDRARAINTIREVVQALAQEKDLRVQQILSTVGPDATPYRPSAGHFTGVALDALDAWYSDHKAALRHAPLPDWSPDTNAAAQELQALARKRRAFTSHDSFIRNYGGFQLLRTSVYLVYASIVAVADHRHTSFTKTLDELLPAQKLSTGAAKGAAFGADATQQVASHEHFAKFETWLRSEEDYADVADEVLEIFEGLAQDAQQAGIDPHLPEDFEPWVDFVHDTTDLGAVMVALDVMRHYVLFRRATDQAPERWDGPHAIIGTILGGDEGMPDDFSKIIAAAEQVDETKREAALNRLPVVSGLLALPDWLATPRGITPSRVLRRADIGTVAAMIGLDAKGVAKLPDHAGWPQRAPEPPESTPDDQSALDIANLPEPDPTIYVQSALDIPELMAWWSTLLELDIITLTASRVKLGESAKEYVSAQQVPLEQAEIVASTYINNILTAHLERMPHEADALVMTVKQLIDTMSGQYTQRYVIDREDELTTYIMELSSDRHFQYLQDARVLEVRGDDIVIPKTLHIPLTVGLMMTFEDLAYSAEFGTQW